MDIEKIQQELISSNIDGWLFYVFHKDNDIASNILEIPSEKLLTRRCFYWIPQKGKPIKIVHIIEEEILAFLPGKVLSYLSWRELHKRLQELLSKVQKVAMEYSPFQSIPTVSKVDAGLIELIRDFGVEIVSSASLIQKIFCRWNDDQYKMHKKAASVLEFAVEQAWNLIKNSVENGKKVTEHDIQKLILEVFKENHCVTEGLPICGVNRNSADPHYCPKKNGSEVIKKGDFVLIDLWCKQDLPQSVFADITRVGVVASEPTKKQNEIFSIVRKAQQEGTNLIIKRFQKGLEIKGAEVDQLVRQIIGDQGYGDYFTHRTGHNINIDNHGPGANLDGLETQDDRLLIPRTCFSIEPGIYLPEEFGVRLEYDVFIHSDFSVEITVNPQEEIVTIL